MSATSAILWAAQDQKMLARNGIDADLVFMPGSPTLIAAINSGGIAVGFTGGTATLGAAAGGSDFKILLASHARIIHDLVTRPDIKEPKDLRGKRIGVTAIGGTAWMAGMLGLEQIGLNPDKDNLIISGFGDMRVTTQALESGTIDAGLISGHYSLGLRRRGYNLLGDLEKIPLMGSSVVVKNSYLQSNMDFMKRFIRAMVEAHVFVTTPANKAQVVRILAKRLSLSDTGILEDSYQDLVRRMDKKPYPSVEAMRNIQRFLAPRNPKIAQIKAQDLLDDSILRDLDKTGYIDRLYSEYK
jgi:NitT/TauT family transport system substrate-binding protein